MHHVVEISSSHRSEFSPIAQKTKLLLTAAGVPFERVDVPNMIPRKDLESIGITYRRVPILAIGKSIYCDSKVIFDVVLQHLAKIKVPTSPAVSTPVPQMAIRPLRICVGRCLGAMGLQCFCRYPESGSSQSYVAGVRQSERRIGCESRS
jgi:hypothetical protein